MASEVGAEVCRQCLTSMVLGRRYRLRGLLGMGRAVDYIAERYPDGQRVALKVFDFRDQERHGWLTRAQLEAGLDTLQRLRHPALPRIHDAIAELSGRFVIVTELLHGGSLPERVREGLVTPIQLAHMTASLLEVLVKLHAADLLHLDIKPSNILFRSAGSLQPVLVDHDMLSTEVARNAASELAGAPGYTAPEMAQGQPGPAADLYGLGATLLYAATGTDASEWPRSPDGKPELSPRLGHLSPEFAQVLLTLVEPSCTARYASASAAARALRSVPELALEPEPITPTHEASANTARAFNLGPAPAPTVSSSLSASWGPLLVLGFLVIPVAVILLVSFLSQPDLGELSAPETSAEEAILASAADRLQACSRGDEAPHRLRYRWRIDDKGEVSSIELLSQAHAGSETAACVEGVLRGLRFSEGERVVELPIVLE